jgi:hypothetical protein
VLLRRGLDERLEALQTKLAEALAPQRAAYDETAQAAEARINQLRRLPAEEPAKLVGEELEVHRVPEGASAGKFAPAKVVAAPGAREGQTFTVVYKDDEAKRVKVDLATAKWRPAGGVAPPRFEWHESTDAALLAACERQLLLQDKEREWAQLRAKLLALAPALAPALQTSGAEPPAEERKADKEKDKEAAEAGGTGHPEFKALLSRVQKCFPAKWMTAAKLATRLKQLKEAARKEASAKKEAELAAKKEAAATAAAKREGLQAAAQAADTQAAAAGQLPEAVEAAAQQAVAAAAAASGPAAPDTSWMATPAAAGADVAPTAAAPEEV